MLKVEISKWQEHLQCLKDACGWLDVSRGRARDYQKLLKEYFEEDLRTREHILAMNESCEICDIYNLWKEHVRKFPDRLKDKIKRTFGSGGILREGEKSSNSSNRARNDAFVFYLAGKLINAGADVFSVESICASGATCQGDADVTLNWNGTLVDVQCKRPQNANRLEERAEEALSQINKAGREGIIAIDCSATIRPPGKLLPDKSEEMAVKFLDSKLDKHAVGLSEYYNSDRIRALILFARAPANITVSESPILSSRGKRYVYYRPYSVCSFLVFINDAYADHNALKAILGRIASQER
ncbi:MAG: hypothetical protein AABZ64_05070 [Nitrospinota bacterium]